MKKILLITACIISTHCIAQRVAINTDGSAPNASAILDVKSSNKGFLPPRIALTGATDVVTIAAPATGLLIYNTATAGTGTNTVSPGYYYYNGTAWTSFGVASGAWLTSGNSVSTGNFIGTSNAENLLIKVNGDSSGVIDPFNGNTFLGHLSGLTNNGILNTGLGANALQFSTVGSNNSAVGANTLSSNSIGENNTAMGAGALYSNTTGNNNTAAGVVALFANTAGNNNSAFGINTLASNTTGENNTASGLSALYSNSTGSNNTGNGINALQSNTTGNYNTAAGINALQSNSSGESNTAAGANALAFNSTGQYNTANGDHSMYNNTTGSNNTASGISALLYNDNGNYNAAFGSLALISNTSGNNNVAMGAEALRSNVNGENNTALGTGALYNNSIGSGNIALGNNAGSNLTTGIDNITIGNNGLEAESGTIRIGTDETHSRAFIAGINGSTSASGVAVYINPNGQLGTLTSSARFKDDIEDMKEIGDDLLKLRPVTFVYKDEVANGDKTLQYGLIAEEVAKINPSLVMFDKEGKPYTVRYQMLTPMLINELQKEHQVNQEQDEKIKLLQKELDELKLLIQQSKK